MVYPYEVVKAGGPFALSENYIYPLTTSVIALPFAAWLPMIPAAALFMAVSSGLLAWGATKDGFHRMPLFLSLPFFWAVFSGQWSPLIMAAILVPSLGWVFPVKPQIGIAGLVFSPSSTAFVGSVIFCLVTLAVNPYWPAEWYALLMKPSVRLYRMPVSIIGGPLLLLAALKWKRPEARMLLVLSVMPQLFLFYDQLLLWLIPRTWKGNALLSILSWIALPIANRNPDETVYASLAFAPVVMAFLYLPALAMVLLRPNVARDHPLAPAESNLTPAGFVSHSRLS